MARWAIFTGEWWKNTGTPRSMVAMTAVLSVILTTVVSTMSSVFLSDKERRDDARAERVSTLVDSMTEFQVFVSAFSTEMFASGEVGNETRSRLIENLNRQYASVRSVQPYLQDTDAALAEEYLDRIEAASIAVSSTTDIVTMSDFWSKVSDITVLRNRFGPKLEALI